MPIRSEDLDPDIALALRERMREIVSTQVSLEPGAARLRSVGVSRSREAVRRNTYHFWAAGACLLGGIAALPLIAPAGPAIAITALLGMQGLGAGLVVRGIRKANRELTEFAHPEVLRHADELIAVSPAERLYCESVAALIDAERALPEDAQGEIVVQLNDLLASFRKLDTPVRQSLAALGNQPVEGLERELEELVDRQQAMGDPAARTTMEQSIALCSQRLSDARALAPARDRAEAQQGLILQALASVHASLARMALADSSAAQADVAQLQRTVTRVNQEARAVEAALEEVLALRA